MPRLTATDWTYQEARQAVIEEFGGEEILFTRKSKFGTIKFAPGKTLKEFVERFYHDVLVDIGSSMVSSFDIHAAMKQTTHPYKELHRAMAPAYTKGKDVSEIVDCLFSHTEMFGHPNRPEPKQPKTAYKKTRFQKEDSAKFSAHPPNVKGPYCIACNTTGHCKLTCPTNAKKVHVVQYHPASINNVVNPAIHCILISPLVGHFKDKSLAFAFAS
ncbi:hypothetical protein DSO57_1024891 [Entomophthora muscae]|uniref:Uncharacterized protein n=1 Tax=Entomophthora muscae TaxID=34485 RepID=A0ACC2TQ17_9FUNG|nr:hypothetical protein DSO57_1024891 [Entomophthora muscae]